jgi:HK97 family phage portal protein
MRLIDRIRSSLAGVALKAASVAWLPEWVSASFFVPTFRALVQEGYSANGVVFACLSTLAFSFPEPPLRVYRETKSGLEVLPDHPMNALLRRPNSQMGMAEMLRFSVVYEAIGGNVYWYKLRDKTGKVMEVIPLSDAIISPVAGGVKLVDHYLWDKGDGRPEKIDSGDVLHVRWMPDPLAPWRGMAPLQAVAREVDSDNEAGRYQFALLKNDAVPRVVVTSASPTPPDSGTVDRMRHEWQDRYGGENRGMPMILGGGMDVKTLSLNLEQLAFDALRRVPETRICAAMRVPPVLAGVGAGLEQMTYNNVGGMQKFYTERTLIPLWRAFEDEITADLLPEYGKNSGDVVVAFDLHKVQALQDDLKELRTWATGAVSAGYLTVNQALSTLGMPQVKGGDVYLRNSALSVVPIGSEPSPPPQKPPESGTEPPGSGGESSDEDSEDDGEPHGDGDEATEFEDSKRFSPSYPAMLHIKGADKREVAKTFIVAYLQQRRSVSQRLEPALNNYFGGLADAIIGRLLKGGALADLETKALPKAEDLVTGADRDELGNIVRHFYTELAQMTWGTINLEIGADVEFDLTDPAISQVLKTAGDQVDEITETTLGALREALVTANENGWSIDHMVRGDPDMGVPGIREIVEQTYQGRAETIARTELGRSQQQVATNRYAQAGVEKAFVQDDGFEDSALQCVALGQGGAGAVVPLRWAQEHPLGHPRCVRAFSAWFGDEPYDVGALEGWKEAGGDAFISDTEFYLDEPVKEVPDERQEAVEEVSPWLKEFSEGAPSRAALRASRDLGDEMRRARTGFRAESNAEMAKAVRLADRMKDNAEFDAFVKRQKIALSYQGDERRAYAVRFLESTWKETSSDNNPLAVAMQMATEQEFGLETGTIWNPQVLAKVSRLYSADDMLALRSFARTQYNLTQEILEKRGIDELFLVRGMGLTGTPYEAGISSVEISMRPLSSFSTSAEHARWFATRTDVGLAAGDQRILMGVSVPRERVFSFAESGVGEHMSEEVVVLGGGRTQVYASVRSSREMSSLPKTVAALAREIASLE